MKKEQEVISDEFLDHLVEEINEIYGWDDKKDRNEEENRG
ncbi:bacitracin ABC transporter ATP-binding protein [Paenibacillus alvei]